MLHNYKKADNIDVKNWLITKLQLTDYQKELVNNEFIRESPFEFMEDKPIVKNFWWRCSIILYPIVTIILYCTLPFKFLISGRWGYSYENLKWYDNWKFKIGL